MRYDQEAYFQKYGASVLWSYAPKSDATIIILILLILANWLSWAAQKHRWQQVADRLIKAAVEDWTPSMGGTTESKQLREEALKLLEERQLQQEQDQQAADEKDKATISSPSKAKPATSSPAKGNYKKQGSKGKLRGKEKKEQEQENLKPIIKELVDQIDNFGAGFHKPTWRDLFIVRLVKFPYFFASGLWWHSKYWTRRLQKKELNEEERMVLTERAVGNVAWELSSEEERAELVKRELWIMDNLVDWKEEQEVKTWSKADQKYYYKMKKKEKGGKEQ